MSTKEMREKLGGLAKRIRELADRYNADPSKWAATDEDEWKRVNGEYDELKAKLDRALRGEDVDREMSRDLGREDYDGRQVRAESDRRDREEDRAAGRRAGSDGAVAITERHRALGQQAWFREQCGLVLDEEHEEACRLTRSNPRRRYLDIRLSGTDSFRRRQQIFRGTHPSQIGRALDELDLAEQRALSAVTSTAGGVTVPQTTIARLERAMLWFGGMLQVSEILQTDSGEPMTWPTVNDTGNKGRQVGEGAAATTLDPTFGGVVWNAYKFTSDEVLIPTELFEDSIFGPERLSVEIGDILGERLGRIANEKATTGTGAATVRGAITAAALGKTAASATAIAADEIIDLVHSVDPAYRQMESRFMFHDNILLAIRKLKDANNLYLFQPNAQLGLPDTIHGYPYTINNDMASAIATTNKTILFGPFRFYKFRQVRMVRLYRLVERHRENDQDAFLAFTRFDGNLLNAGTNPLKFLQQA